MKFSRARTALAALSIIVGTTTVHAKVVVLDDQNFEHLTQASTGQTTGKWFVMFYAAWCGHCHRLLPIWDNLDEALVASSSSDAEEASPGDQETHVSSTSGIVIAKMDAMAARVTSQRFGIQGYPTLLYFADRRMYKYEGPRYADDMKAYVVSGYRNTTPLDVPPPLGFVEVQRIRLLEFVNSHNQLSMLVGDFKHIVDVRKNAAVVLLVMGLIVGLLLGCMVGCFCRSGKKKGTRKEKTE